MEKIQSASPDGVTNVAPNEDTAKCANLLVRFVTFIPLMPPGDDEKLRNLISQLVYGNIEPRQFCTQFQDITATKSAHKFQQLLEEGLTGVRELLAMNRLCLSGIEFDMAKLQHCKVQHAPTVHMDNVLLTSIYANDSDIVPDFNLNNEACELTEQFYRNTVERSCVDVQLLAGSPLKKRIHHHMRVHSIRECVDVVPTMISHACEWRLKDILDKLCSAAKNRQAIRDDDIAAKKKPRLTYRISKKDLLWVLEQDRVLFKSHFLHALYLQ